MVKWMVNWMVKWMVKWTNHGQNRVQIGWPNGQIGWSNGCPNGQMDKLDGQMDKLDGQMDKSWPNHVQIMAKIVASHGQKKPFWPLRGLPLKLKKSENFTNCTVMANMASEKKSFLGIFELNFS